MPMSDERRALIAREEEREAAEAQRQADLAAEVKAERAAELAFLGVVPTSVGERLQSVAFGMDRQDAVEARQEREAAELLGKPAPRGPYSWELKRQEQQREAAEIITPASKSDVSKLSAAISGLKAKLSGQRSESVSETPEEYARNYGDGGIRYRSGGPITGGPY
jgi:hypothetical protein